MNDKTFARIPVSLAVQMLFVTTTAVCKMRMVSFFENLFPLDAVPTEARSFELLKQDPIDADVAYLAVPWAVLINTNRLHKVPIERYGPGFAICQHICFKRIIPILEQCGIDVLFTPHTTHVRKVGKVSIEPYPHAAINAPDPAAHKDLFYSFVGFDAHGYPARKKMFSTKHPEDTIIIERSNWHFWRKDSAFQRDTREYMDILSRSRFSLCPRGTGPSSIRFWESFKAGSVPVLVSDAIRLPEWFDWDECVIKVPELEVEKIPTILQEVAPEKERSMRNWCLRAHEQFQGKNLVSCVRKYYKSLNRS